MAKSTVSFVEGLHISFQELALNRGLEQWYLVGYVEGQPFYLHYFGLGVTTWDAPINLTQVLRRRILAQFKKEVRGQKQGWLRELEFGNGTSIGPALHDTLGAEATAFHTVVWRDKMLDDRDEDYIVLNVPYAQREEAQKAGAVWRGKEQVWVVHKRLDQRAVAQWISSAQAQA